MRASLFGALKAGAGGCDWPCVWTMLAAASMWTMLPMLLVLPGVAMLASMAWTMSFFYGLEYAFAYACYYDTLVLSPCM
jgi:hypothetical protein